METTGNVLNFLRPSGLPFALAILIVTWLASRFVVRTQAQLAERFGDRRLTIQQVAALVRFAIFVLGGLGAAATVLQLTQEVMLALGGTIAVALGFALKDFAASIVAGFIILVDRPFQVGDRVSFDGYYGEIRHIGLRSVRLLTLDDTQVTIPNNKFLTDSVASGNAGAVEMMVQMDFYIGADQDAGLARKLASEALTSSRYVSLDLPWNVSLAEVLQESFVAVRVRAKAYVLDVRFENAFSTDVAERVLEAFQKADILPPASLSRRV